MPTTDGSNSPPGRSPLEHARPSAILDPSDLEAIARQQEHRDDLLATEDTSGSQHLRTPDLRKAVSNVSTCCPHDSPPPAGLSTTEMPPEMPPGVSPKLMEPIPMSGLAARPVGGYSTRERSPSAVVSELESTAAPREMFECGDSVTTPLEDNPAALYTGAAGGITVALPAVHHVEGVGTGAAALRKRPSKGGDSDVVDTEAMIDSRLLDLEATTRSLDLKMNRVLAGVGAVQQAQGQSRDAQQRHTQEVLRAVQCDINEQLHKVQESLQQQLQGAVQHLLAQTQQQVREVAASAIFPSAPATIPTVPTVPTVPGVGDRPSSRERPRASLGPKASTDVPHGPTPSQNSNPPMSPQIGPAPMSPAPASALGGSGRDLWRNASNAVLKDLRRRRDGRRRHPMALSPQVSAASLSSSPGFGSRPPVTFAEANANASGGSEAPTPKGEGTLSSPRLGPRQSDLGAKDKDSKDRDNEPKERRVSDGPAHCESPQLTAGMRKASQLFPRMTAKRMSVQIDGDDIPHVPMRKSVSNMPSFQRINMTSKRSVFAGSTADDSKMTGMEQSGMLNQSNLEHTAEQAAHEESAKAKQRSKLITQDDTSGIGFRENHPLVIAADVAFAIIGTISLCLALAAAFPSSPSRDTSHWMFSLSLAFNAATQLFTAAWIALRFFVQTRHGDWEIIDRTDMIRSTYLRTWFAFDLAYTLPFDWAFLGWAPTVYFYLQLRAALRIVRFVSMGRSSNPLAGGRSWVRFMAFMCIGVVVIHTAALVFSEWEGEGYVTALYWAVATVTGVGYGDVTPSSGDAARLYGVLSCLLGVVLLSTATAFATSFLTSNDKLSEQLEHKKQMMHSMLHYYDIPWHIQREVITMFPAVLDSQSEAEFTSMTEAMPAFISQKIEGYARAKIIRGVPLFARLKQVTVIVDLSRRLQQRWASPQEHVVEVGEVGREMFFLVRGVVDVSVPAPNGDEIVVACLRSGQYFGEIALIEDTVRTATVQALTLCELLVLGKEDFLSVTGDHQELHELFEDEVLARRRQVVAAVKQVEAEDELEQEERGHFGSVAGDVLESGSDDETHQSATRRSLQKKFSYSYGASLGVSNRSQQLSPSQSHRSSGSHRSSAGPSHHTPRGSHHGDASPAGSDDSAGGNPVAHHAAGAGRSASLEHNATTAFGAALPPSPAPFKHQANPLVGPFDAGDTFDDDLAIAPRGSMPGLMLEEGPPARRVAAPVKAHSAPRSDDDDPASRELRELEAAAEEGPDSPASAGSAAPLVMAQHSAIGPPTGAGALDAAGPYDPQVLSSTCIHHDKGAR